MFGSFPDDLLEQFRHDYAERGKPCGNSHISASKTCRVGLGHQPTPEAHDVKELTDKAKEFTFGKPWTKDHQEVWDRVLSAEHTKHLGQVMRKLEKEVYDEDKYEVSAGFMKGIKGIMKGWLETNQRTGVGAKKQAELEAMSPEDRKRAAAARRIEAGIKGGVVKGRMR